MVVAIAFEPIISPVVEIAPINAGDANAAFNVKLASTSAFVYYLVSPVRFVFKPTLISVIILLPFAKSITPATCILSSPISLLTILSLDTNRYPSKVFSEGNINLPCLVVNDG